MQRRDFIASAATLLLPNSASAPPKKAKSQARYVLCGDSMAYVMGPSFREEGDIHQANVAVWAKGGSSARQWLKKKWFQRVIADHPRASTLLVSLGVNCTRVERPKLAEDVSTIVNLVNDLRYDGDDDEPDWSKPHVAWLLPPPLAMNTDYIHEAVAKSEVFSIAPGPLPLESDGIHPTRVGARRWAYLIARALWE